MKAAIVESFAKPPRYSDFPEPTLLDDEVLVSVTASALSTLVKGQASGRHYSSATVFPFVPGVDGVGRLADGTRIYFGFPRPPYGAMAELVPVQSRLTVALPDDLDDITAAAIANPGMSSWAGLAERARLVPGESVLINGATGVAGRLAVQIAKYLGAKYVVATGRNPAALATLPSLGADAVIALDQAADMEPVFRKAMGDFGVNVVLDYLWGPSAEQIISSIAGHGSPAGEPRVRYVQVGSMSGTTISMPAGALRSSGLELLGTGLGSISYVRLVANIGNLMAAVVPGGLQVSADPVPLRDVETAWTSESGGRIVFTI